MTQGSLKLIIIWTVIRIMEISLKVKIKFKKLLKYSPD